MTTSDRTMNDTRRWEDYQDTYRSDWDRKYGKDRDWNEYGPAYRYGWERAQQDSYHNREWHDVESDLSRDWPTYYKNSYEKGDWRDDMAHTWDRFKDAVQEGWHRARLEWNRH